MKRKDPAAVSLGRLGGKAGTGKSKVRKVTSAMARNAANARWSKAARENGKRGGRPKK